MEKWKSCSISKAVTARGTKARTVPFAVRGKWDICAATAYNSGFTQHSSLSLVVWGLVHPQWCYAGCREAEAQPSRHHCVCPFAQPSAWSRRLLKNKGAAVAPSLRVRKPAGRYTQWRRRRGAAFLAAPKAKVLCPPLEEGSKRPFTLLEDFLVVLHVVLGFMCIGFRVEPF